MKFHDFLSQKEAPIYNWLQFFLHGVSPETAVATHNHGALGVKQLPG
jgi:hypothetical protein